ncbi:MAG: chemotaxis protein CheW [Gammaproteobacteria bacterium]|nr:chemotaxis protein CheW [Gammaproteobacteria bacterium]
MSTQSQSSMTLLHFMVQDLQCCLHIKDVERMMSLLDMQVIPGSAEYLLGMMNLHGNSIPVIDLGLRIGHPQIAPYTLETPIILCCHNGGHIGLVVTEILEVQECDIQTLQVRPEFEQGAQPYEAVINTGHGLSLLLDLDRIGGVQLGSSDIMARLTDIELYGGAA